MGCLCDREADIIELIRRGKLRKICIHDWCMFAVIEYRFLLPFKSICQDFSRLLPFAVFVALSRMLSYNVPSSSALGTLMFEFFHQFDITQWVVTVGYVGIVAIILLETGFFAGFFLPGDSLVFSTGLLASKGIFNIWILVPALIVAAIIGYTIGYWFGDKLGHWLMRQRESIFFKRQYIHRAHEFYKKHGGKALILGRLIPVVRTFAPIVAGMVHMNYRMYFFFNIIGALVWCGGITTLGYCIGSMIPDAGHYIFPIALVVIFISILPGVWHYFRDKCQA